MLRTFLTLAALTLAGSAQAGFVACDTSIRGEDLHFVYDPENAALKASRSMRDRLMGAHGAISCPGLVTLRAMTPEMDDAARAPFCLQWDRKAKTYIGYAQGPRDAWLGCRKPSRSFCERVNGSKAAALHLASETGAGLRDLGLAVMRDPSGAVLVQGSAPAIGAQLSAWGASAAGTLSAPATLSALAITAVAVGGAVYVCSDSGASGAALEGAGPTHLEDGAEVTGE
jgi:hypothetical protein